MPMRKIITKVLMLLMAIPFVGMAQTPTMTYNGSSLRVSVPTGRLDFSKSEIGNNAIRDCFEWRSDDGCTFMAQEDDYVIALQGLPTDEPVSVNGVFNGEPVTIDVEMRVPVETQMPKKTGEDEGINLTIDTNTLIMAGGALALIVLLIVVIVVIKKKRSSKQPQNDPNIISIINDESITYEHGLKHVIDRPNEYLSFDMDKVFVSSAVNKVYMSTDLVKKLYDFFSNSLEAGGRTNETGCFIVGCWDQGRDGRYDVSLEYMVEPGDDADFGEYSLNFGKKISVNMASVIDNLAQKSKRDYLLTCWMHSHPGLGLFLSNQDLIVQRQLTYPDHANRLIAIVIDTNTPDFKTGFFTAKRDGKMNNKEEVKQWFSFEDIYREARDLSRNNVVKEETVSRQPVHDGYSVELENGELRSICFAPHAINQIESTLYSSTKGVAGYLFGDIEGDMARIDCCLTYENDEKIGCLVYQDNLTESVLAAYASKLSGCSFVINSTNDDKLYIWTKSDGSFVKTGETSLPQMKEWIRRKRV